MTFTPWEVTTILFALVLGVVNIVQYIKREELQKEIRDYKEPMLHKLRGVYDDLTVHHDYYEKDLASMDEDLSQLNANHLQNAFVDRLKIIVSDMTDFRERVASSQGTFGLYNDLETHRSYYVERLASGNSTDADAGSLKFEYRSILRKALSDMDTFRTHILNEIELVDPKGEILAPPKAKVG